MIGYMGKIYKKAGKNKARMIVEYEHAEFELCAPLDDPFGDAGGVFDGEANPGDMAAQALADARHQAEMKVHEAYNEGLRRGIEAGREEFERSVGAAADALADAVAQMARAHEQFLESLEPQVMRLVEGIAERVIGREVRTDPQLVLNSVRRALASLTDRARVTVKVNPSDLAVLREWKTALLDGLEGVVQCSMEADEGVSPGGCVIDTDTCHVDARMDEILRRVIEELAD